MRSRGFPCPRSVGMSRTPRARVETLLLDFARRLERKEFGNCFELASGDLVFVGRESHAPQIQSWVNSLNFLFRSDPLQRATDEDGRGRFCQWCDLAADLPVFLAYCEGLAATTTAARAPAPGDGAPERACDAEGLLAFSAALGALDVAGSIQRRPVCLLAGGAAQVVLEEVSYPVAEFGRRALPDVDLAGERNLVHYVKEAIDLRLLDALAAGARSTPLRRIGLTLSLAAIDSLAFRRFDAALDGRAQTSIVIAFQPADVFADITGFARISQHLRAREYRIALAGVSLRAFTFLDRTRLGVDPLTLAWQPGLDHTLDDAARQMLREAVARAGAARVVLGETDSPAALALGRELGIHLFQGPEAEAMLNPPTSASARA
ncbi:MAG: EAL domain-containing protein [Alphaproteobacteria bacterium]|nr:EAL domain-containing protein [Alphaproteobacteria bacterium]